MSYHFDSYDQALVVDGWENGIGDSPHSGLSDMRNVNIVSVPGEASVNFSTQQASSPVPTTGTVTSVNSGTDTITYTGFSNLESGMAVVFAGTVPAGISTGTVAGAGTIYWLGNVSGGTFKVYTDINLTSLVDITNTTTGATFIGFTMGQPKHYAYDNINVTYWMVDATGYVWTNAVTTASNLYWVYSGNRINSRSNGNGLVFYPSSSGVGYLFVFSNSSIDWTQTLAASISWSYQWPRGGGAAAGYSNTPSKILNTAVGTNNSHEALVGQDNVVYYCDGSFIGSWFEKAGSVFDPTNSATITPALVALGLPTIDTAQCLAELGINLLVGGKRNQIYPWNRTGNVIGGSITNSYSYPILLGESNVQKMVTVNTNTYIFVGNRGRIYVTNGTNANLFKKVPDHISGTVEPYFTWGGATFNKNQLYFGVLAKKNDGITTIPQYGGLWAIDLDTKAIRLVNEFSYGDFSGYATAMIANFSTSPAGTGLFIGWLNGNAAAGIDTTIGTPYTSTLPAMIDSDLIPIGTFNKPRDFTKVEYRLTKPMVSGERITIKTRLIFNTQDTGYTTTLDDFTVGNYSNIGDINFKNAQWVQFQIVTQSTASNPSFTRVKDIRILGLTGPTPASSQQLSL